MRRIAGAAGLAYVAGVGIENMEVLTAPTLGSPIADIRAYYGDQAFAVVTSFAGALGLLFYALFAASLFGLMRGEDRRGDPWAVAALVGGIGGPALAGMGLAANAVLVANSGTGLTDDLTRTLFDLYLTTRMVSGVFVALFLVGTGIAALRTNALPRWLARAACAIGAAVAFSPLAAFTGERALEVAVGIVFAAQTLWIFATGLWLALAEDAPPLVFVRRSAFLVLVIAAGLVGIGLLAAPGGTGKFFAWGLGPEPLAAFAGGVYVGAAALYAVAVAQPWRRVQGLVVGAVVLSVSVLAVTLAHLEEFDFDRLQAGMWLFLFTGFALIMIAVLVTGRNEGEQPPRTPLQRLARTVLGTAAGLLGALAIALWIDPTALSDESPWRLSPLGGRFAGSWIALLAALAGWAAVRNDVEEARLPVLGLVLLPGGALVAALRTISDLDPAGSAAVYIAGLAALIVAAVAVALALRAGYETRMSSRHPFLIAALGLVVVAGCGSSNGAGEDEVRETVRTFGQAFVQARESGDGEPACAVMTGEAERQLGEFLSAGANTDPEVYLFGHTCGDVVLLAAEQDLDPETFERVTSTEVESVDVDGDSATAEVAGGARHRLERSEGKWEVAEIGGLE